jgi:transposase
MKYLFRPQDLPLKIPYEKVFALLPPFGETPKKARGRPAFSRAALLRALIYKNLRGLPSLSELAFELRNNPVISELLGFPAWETPPSVERFSHFLRHTENHDLQTLRRLLVQYLIAEKVITGKSIAMDSCAIEANVQENNLKTAVSDRFDKTRPPRGDPDSRLGIKLFYPQPFQRKVTFFWGYRNHILIDTLSELPVHEKTLPANQDEKKQALPLLQELRAFFQLPVEAVAADANYDTEEILSFIFYDMKALPVIPKNPRGQPKLGFQLRKNSILCPGNLKMHRRGKMTVRGRTYLQYSCPLYYEKNLQSRFLACPAFHPKYFQQKGCNYLLRLSPTVRWQIDYNSQRFKKMHKQRTAVERVFSRLLTITMQTPTVIGLQATQNHCTIAHISVLLIALAAHRLGFDDKIRFVKTFLPNL